jgi:uncharacterized repeat protein (TIGR01451 family)
MNLDTLVDVADLVSMLINVQAIAGAPLQLSVIASQDPVRPSEFLQYLLTVTNTTRTDFPDVVLENTLPEDITVGNPDSPTSGGAFNDGQTFFWNLGTLPAGESRSRGFTTQVNGGSFAPPDGTVLLDVGHAFDSTGREATTEAAVTVKATNDLTLRISADKGVAGWGDELTYLIVYGNRSATTSLNTSLIVTLPEHVEFESATGGGSLVGSEVQWNLESITPGATAHQQFTVNVPQLRSGAQLVATASITGSDSRMAESTVSTPVRGNSPLDLTMAMSHDPIRPGEMLHTVLTVTNRGNSELPNVTLRNTMGGRVGVANPDTATSGGGTSDGQTFFWNLGNLPAGASETRGYTHLVDGGAFSPPEGTVIRTTARVVDDAGNEDFAVADIRVETSDDLTLLMSADKRPVQPGEVLTFALNFGNRSAGTSTGTAMSASVPEGTSFLSATGGGTHVGEEVQWDLGSLAPGENGVRRFKVTVIPGLAAGRQVASIAEIENGARSQSAQTKCFVPVQVNPPLNVSVVFSPNPVRPSGILNVLLTASNQGAGDFTDVELAHTLPAGVGSASVDTSPVTGQIGDGDTFRWNLGTLAVGQSVTRGYTLLVDGGAFSRPEGTLQRHFTRLHEPLGSEAMDQTDVRIEHDEDLMMRVRTNRGPVAPGETLKHTVDFTNRGSSTLTFVELRAQVPEGSTFVSASDNGLLVGDQVEWNIGTLEAGAGNQRRFTVTVDGDAEDGDHMVSKSPMAQGTTAVRQRRRRRC